MTDRSHSPSRAPLIARLTIAVSALCFGLSASAMDYQIHGYAAQGFVFTSDNNFFGESSDGSFDYYEAGINAQVQVGPSLLLSAQAAVRDAGISDDGSLRMDYALADYRLISDATAQAGFRVGKVKNTIGFYNETRDVVFTRPSILLPSVYSDNQNQRSVIFAAPGAQVYGAMLTGQHEWSFTGTLNAERDVRRSDERLLVNLGGVPFDLRVGDSWNVQLMDSIDGGRWQFAYSHFTAQFRLTTAPEIGLKGRFTVDADIFSARYNAERISITAEYALVGNDNLLTLADEPVLRQNVKPDNGYIQAEYRLRPQWNLMARMDSSYRDRHDRSGSKFAAANPGEDRRSQVSHDFTVGINWRPDEHWGLWAEHHWINGTASLQALENPPPVADQRWRMLMLMVGYKF
jgi:hypothetical protein